MVDGGVLIVTAPNFGRWRRRAFGAGWLHLDPPRHRSDFIPVGIGALLNRSGFGHKTIATSTSPDGLPMSPEYRLLRGTIVRATGRYLAAGMGLVAATPTAASMLIGGAGDILHVGGMKDTVASGVPGDGTGPRADRSR
jgi:hypothetical protein